mgnify:FL=1
MNDFVKEFKDKNFDGINFYRNDKGNIEVTGFEYKDPGEKQPGTDLGDLYDIIILSEEPPRMPERFKAILISPLHYISRMLDDGFLGVVAKATTTSENFMGMVFEHLTAKTEKYIEYYERLKENEQV